VVSAKVHSQIASRPIGALQILKCLVEFSVTLAREDNPLDTVFLLTLEIICRPSLKCKMGGSETPR